MQNTIQWFHDKENRKTYAVNVEFSKEALLNVVHHHTEPFMVEMGIAQVHPNDSYCRKTGREISSKKLHDIKLELCELTVDGAHVYLTLENTKNRLLFKFRVHRDSSKPHLIKVQEYFNYIF